MRYLFDRRNKLVTYNYIVCKFIYPLQQITCKIFQTYILPNKIYLQPSTLRNKTTSGLLSI